MGKLWSDLNSDKARIEFLRSGQAVNTGIMAPAIVPDIIGVYEYRAAQKKEEASGTIDNSSMHEIADKIEGFYSTREKLTREDIHYLEAICRQLRQ